MALAGKSSQQTFSDFIDEVECDQFLVGTDSNSFKHAYSDFPGTYQISEMYLNRLLSVCSYSEQMQALSVFGMNWVGSCYGIASTMVLNKLSKLHPASDPEHDDNLHIDRFQAGAQSYFELGVPKDNPSVLDMINYYMGSQNMRVATENSIYVNLYDITLQNTTTANDADTNLRNFISAATESISIKNEPMLFSFFYPTGGHAIVLCDYAEAPIKTDGIMFKLYDENDRSYAERLGRPHYKYLEITKDSDGLYRAKEDLVKLYEFDPQKHLANDPNPYTEHPLNSFKLINIGEVNKTINIHKPIEHRQEPDDIELTIKNVAANSDSYAIKPFVMSDGNIMGNVKYAEHTGALLNDAAVSSVPIPINANSDPVTYYGNMNTFRYSVRGELSRALDLTIEHNPSGRVGDNADAAFDGYDVATSCGMLSDFYVSKENSDGGSFAAIQGRSIGTARFDAKGRLCGMFTDCGEGAQSVTLYCGSYASNVDLDMFKLYAMSDFKKLEISYDDPNNIILHFDRFPDQMGLQFFKGTLISPDHIGITSNDRLNDRWLRIGTENVNGVIEISVYRGHDDGSGNIVFNDTPDCTTKLQSRYASGSYHSGSSVEIDYRHYAIFDGENARWTGGDFTIRVDAPISKYVSTSVDGISVPKESLTVAEGSTVVTISEAYLAALKPGEHTLRIQFTNGYAQTTLTTGGNKTSNAFVPDVPPTGSFGGGLALLCFLPALLCAFRKRSL